jgi:hypothetical protein
MSGSLRVERCYRPDRERETRALLLLLGRTATNVPSPQASHELRDGAALTAGPEHGGGAG